MQGYINDNGYKKYKITSDDYLLTEYMKETKHHSILTKEEEQQLFIEIQKGNKVAKDKIIENNQKLVITVALKYFNYSNEVLTKIDMISEGNLGLIRAIEKYDYKKDMKFSTYAVFWIKDSIIRAIIKQRKIIRVPENKYYEWKDIYNYINNYKEKYNRTPTNKEIIKALKIDNQKLVDFYLYYNNLSDLVSLDINVDIDDPTVTIQDIIEDKNFNIDKQIDNICLKEDFEKIIKRGIETKQLTERDIAILKKRIAGRTYTSIGKEYNITKERVRQIVQKSIRYFRQPQNKARLRDYLY